MNRKIVIMTCFILICTPLVFSQTWRHFTTANSGLPSNYVKAVSIDHNNVKWFGTNAGLASYNDSSWFVYTTDNNLAHNQINDTAFEMSESGPALWIGTEAGVSMVSIPGFDDAMFAFPFRTDNSELLSNKINAVIVDLNQVKWFGTDQGVSVFNDEIWAAGTIEDVLHNNHVISLYATSDNIVYNGTLGGGVNRLEYSEMDVITAASKVSMVYNGCSDSVYALYIEDDVQWFGTSRGALRHVGKELNINWKRFTPDEGLVHPHVQAIAKDSTDKLWFGTQGGASCLDTNLTSSINYTTENGLISNHISDIAVDVEGAIWFATDGGVSKLKIQFSAVKSNTNPKDFKKLNLANHPNPFNAYTMISYRLDREAAVRIDIFNMRGELVKSLIDAKQSSGLHSIQWNGTMENGGSAATGIYIYRLTINTPEGVRAESNKMMLLR